MKLKKLNPQKSRAQAIVEFAIALPVLLMLVYGLLEVGRLLFVYMSAVNATRQAVRYGSTTGVGSDGVTPRYLDCAGIRTAAKAGDYLNVFKFDDNNITITYDGGPGTGQLPNGTCPVGATASSVDITSDSTKINKSRIVVSINYDFKALIPKLVPFISRTTANGNPMNATSARTIITSITIKPTPNVAKDPTTTFIKYLLPTEAEVGQPVLVVVSVTSSGSTTPTGEVYITGADVNCTVTLTAGEGSCLVTFTSVTPPNLNETRTVTATYSGDSANDTSDDSDNIVVWLATTATFITADTPDPSPVNEAVTVNVSAVSSASAGIPTGTVSIIGTDTITGTQETSCTAPLNPSNGKGSCDLTFPSIGAKTLTATYSGDATHLPTYPPRSFPATASHTVTLAPTATVPPTAGPSPTPLPTSTPVPPACTVAYEITGSWSTGFSANVIITNTGGTAINGWTLAFSYTDGQQIFNMWNASYIQNGGAVTVTNDPPWALINPGSSQSFAFQATSSGSNTPPTSFSLNGVPCTGGAVPPTATPTATLSPTAIPTNTSCTQLSHQTNPSITVSGDSMRMEIYNQTGVALVVNDITVFWNQYGRGNGKALSLVSSALDGIIYQNFTPPVNATSVTFTPSPSISIPTGTSTISFKFDYNYANVDGSEQIYITFTVPGCFLDSKN